jgi:cob(I)alamin adenosyltransferase
VRRGVLGGSLEGHMKSVPEVIAEALADECERCAVIADEYAERARAFIPPANEAAAAAEHIARAIRQRVAAHKDEA